ncbi:unnamed protein product [Caretta caretta]
MRLELDQVPPSLGFDRHMQQSLGSRLRHVCSSPGASNAPGCDGAAVEEPGTPVPPCGSETGSVARGGNNLGAEQPKGQGPFQRQEGGIWQQSSQGTTTGGEEEQGPCGGCRRIPESAVPG